MRIIGYSSIDKALIVVDKAFIASPGPQLIDISSQIALTLTGRGCAGRWEGETYLQCDSPVAPFCPRCSAVADACVICRGECRKPEKTCIEEHSVYLAVFAPATIKVGVSRTWRLETRLDEQGADEGFEIARFPDGEAARKLERAVSARFPDRLGFAEKIGVGGVDPGAIDAVVAEFSPIRRFSFSRFPGPLEAAPIVLKPRVGMAVSGRVQGIKGQALVLEKHDTLYALNLDSLVGFDCADRGSRETLAKKERLQVSLSGFK